MSRHGSDFLRFSALFLLAFFAVPALTGACIAADDCLAALAADCHDEAVGQVDSSCCEVTAASKPEQTSVEKGEVTDLVALSASGPAAAEVGLGRLAPLAPLALSSSTGPLFLLHCSFLA